MSAGPCEGKSRYLTRRDAKKALRRLRGDGGQDRTRGRLNTYRCDVCGFCHIGHFNRAAQRRRERRGRYSDALQRMREALEP